MSSTTTRTTFVALGARFWVQKISGLFWRQTNGHRNGRPPWYDFVNTPWFAQRTHI